MAPEADCTVMYWSDAFWAFARDVAAHTSDRQISFTLLRNQYTTVHPNATADEIFSAEVRLLEMLKLPLRV